MGERRRTQIFRDVLRAAHLVVLALAVLLLLMIALGATAEAVDASTASAAAGNALGAAVTLAFIALILDGPRVRRRYARAATRTDLPIRETIGNQADIEHSSQVDATPRIDGEMSEATRPTDDPVCSDETTTTIRLRPLAP